MNIQEFYCTNINVADYKMLPKTSQGMSQKVPYFLNSTPPLASRASDKGLRNWTNLSVLLEEQICWNRSISKVCDSLVFSLPLESGEMAKRISEGHKETKDSKSDLEKQGLTLYDSEPGL